jgi:hypothetical protein
LPPPLLRRLPIFFSLCRGRPRHASRRAWRTTTGGWSSKLGVRNRMPVSLRGGGGELGNLKP